MCRTVHALLQIGICGIQMLVRVFMTVILMIENLIRMILQTFYNFISFLLQMISLIPICVVFMITARLKCFMCGGGGPCPVNRGGACDCIMSFMAIAIVILIFRATGVLDKIFYSMGYAKAKPTAHTRFMPTPGDITECSRETESTTTATTTSLYPLNDEPPSTKTTSKTTRSTTTRSKTTSSKTTRSTTTRSTTTTSKTTSSKPSTTSTTTVSSTDPDHVFRAEDVTQKWTTVFYYLI